MSDRIYGFCPDCNDEIFNCNPNYLRNIHHVICSKCNKKSYLHEIRKETKETDEFDVYLSPYEALSELQKGTKLEYFDEDVWFTLFEDNPIRLLYEYKIRIK